MPKLKYVDDIFSRDLTFYKNLILKMVILPYCDSNIGLFSIAPHLVNALSTLR